MLWKFIKCLRNLWKRVLLVGVKFDRLHLGSGSVILKGWLNIDFDKSFGEEVFLLDLRKPLSFPDNSVSMIFSEHTIEHLSKKDGLALINECYRVLKHGGVIRFGWPDFEKTLRAYSTNDKKYKAGMAKHMGESITELYDEFTADCLFSWDHRYCYTYRLLREFFSISGFKNIKKMQFGRSCFGFNVDTRNDPDTSYIEGVKNEHKRAIRKS